jgi:tRNA1Val (adenine37-N6)-methyltransferase
MPNSYFQFKQFTVFHDRTAMKVTTDSCLFGAWCAQRIYDKEIKGNILDIGAGTGLLALMIAQQNNVSIEAVEIDKDASEQAAENIAASPWKDQIQVFNQDALTFQPPTPYDCIISNPPFYENELASIQQNRNIAHHSHQLKISQLVAKFKEWLSAEGIFFLLLPYKRLQEVEKLIDRADLYLYEKVVVHQSVKHAPFRVMICGSTLKRNECETTSLFIWDDKQQHTEAFTNLLKPFYLKL